MAKGRGGGAPRGNQNAAGKGLRQAGLYGKQAVLKTMGVAHVALAAVKLAPLMMMSNKASHVNMTKKYIIGKPWGTGIYKAK